MSRTAPRTPSASGSSAAPPSPQWLRGALAAAIAFVVLYLGLLSVLFLTGVPDDRLGEEHAAVRSYVVTPVGRDDLVFLDRSERDHLEDVRALFSAGSLLTLLSIGFAAVTTWALRGVPERRRELFTAALRWAAIGIVGLMTLGVIGALLDFDEFWSAVHAVLFPQGGWRFGPDSRLRDIYTDSYFLGFVLRWGLLVLALGALLAGVASLSDPERAARSRPGRRPKADRR